jgi:hypothetical protein
VWYQFYAPTVWEACKKMAPPRSAH